MEAKQIYEVLTKLIGPVEPMADAAVDSNRYENMEKFIEVFREMHMVIDDIAYQYADSPYGSAKRIGELADKQLDDMGIGEEETKQTIVIAPVGCEMYLTAGKEYLVIGEVKLFFSIIDDYGDVINCVWEKCFHAGGKDWIIKNK
ncbi:MAG: hypothetical protein WD512_05665 [Candidatus Paceibacterota bacterium]